MLLCGQSPCATLHQHTDIFLRLFAEHCLPACTQAGTAIREQLKSRNFGARKSRSRARRPARTADYIGPRQALHSFPGRIHVTLEAAACKSPLSAALPRMCRAGGSGLFSKACARCSGSGVKKAAHNPAFMQRVRGKAMTGQNNVHQWQRPCGQPTDLQDRRRGQPQAEIPKRRLAVRRGQC